MSVHQFEWHDDRCVGAPFGDKCQLGLVVCIDAYLVVARKIVDGGVGFMSNDCVEDLVRE